MSELLAGWKTIDEETVFSADPYVRVMRQKVELPDGKQIDDFYQVHLRSFVVVVPILSDGSILTIRQYKHGPGRTSVTFPAGYIEAGEKPRDACLRELMEETGYQPELLTYMGEFVDNGNQRGCVGHYFFATGCQYIAPPASGDLEEMVIETRTPDDLDQALMAGEFAIIHHASAWSMARLLGLLAT